MSERKKQREVLDREADRVVKAYRDHGVSVDYGETRERLRRNLVREEQQKPRQ